MARVSTYLNFPGNTAPGIRRMSDVPAAPGQPPMSEAAKNLVLHVALAPRAAGSTPPAAVRIAQEFPWTQYGCIEVRPVRDIGAVRQRVGA